jgi:hypothetical protein
VLIRRPLISGTAISTPALDEVAAVIELHDRRRRNGYKVRWSGPRIPKSAWATQDPNVILIVYGDIGSKSHSPLRRDFRKIGILLELGQTAFPKMRRRLSRTLSKRGPG